MKTADDRNTEDSFRNGMNATGSYFLLLTSYYRERSSTFSKQSSLDSPWYWFVVTEVGVGTSQSKCKFEKTFSKIVEFI